MTDATTTTRPLCVHCNERAALPLNRRGFCRVCRNSYSLRKRYPIIYPLVHPEKRGPTEPETMADVEALIAERLALVMNDTTGKYAWWWHHTRACAVGPTKRSKAVVRVRWRRDTLVAEVV